MFFTNYFKKYISDNLPLKGVNNLEIKNKYEKLRVKNHVYTTVRQVDCLFSPD